MPKKSKEKPISISNCTFNGIVWDKTTLEVVKTVAQGLLNLTELFKSQNVQIDALLKIENK